MSDTNLRILILSDTHGLIDPRIEELAVGADLILHAGDIGNRDVLQRLSHHATLHAITGNNDTPAKWPDIDHPVLDALDKEKQLDLPGGQLVILHGHRINPAKQRHEKLRKRYPEARAVVIGHSHHMLVDKETTPWILNPGAAGRERTHGGPSCLELFIRDNDWQVKQHRFEFIRKRA